MSSVTVVVPGPLTTRTGGSIYDRRVVDGLRARGWDVRVIELDAVTHPLSPPVTAATSQFAAIADDEIVVIDGLVFGTMPDVIERESRRLCFVPIVHMPLAATSGLAREQAATLEEFERRALACARHIVVTGRGTTGQVEALLGGTGRIPITWIPPGVDPVSKQAERRDPSGPVRLLCVANLTPGKGHEILFAALARVTLADWELTCVGGESRDPQHAQELRALADRLGIGARIKWAGELGEDALEAEYARADVFVLATRGETFGMAVAEAIAHGLPVVSTRTGEIPMIVGDGGRLAAPDDLEEFVDVLNGVVNDADLRKQLAINARAAARRLPTWNDAVVAFEQVLKSIDAADPRLAAVASGSLPNEPRGEPESLSAWLALRQPADFAARSQRLTAWIADHVQQQRPIRVLDLGTGTGSNIRYLSPRLDGPQEWLAVDRDPRLLAEAGSWRASGPHDVRVETCAMNLGELTAPAIFDGRHLVTASALLDLVSEGWLRQLAAECRRVGACALFPIIYNGLNECTPPDPDDGLVFTLFNRHQFTDKGLGGPAAGPLATNAARRCFEDEGFEVRVEPSDWMIGPDQRELQRQLIVGWASAATELSSLNDPRPQFIADWRQRRLAHVDAGRSHLVVGHYDLAAVILDS